MQLTRMQMQTMKGQVHISIQGQQTQLGCVVYWHMSVAQRHMHGTEPLQLSMNVYHDQHTEVSKQI